MAFGDILTDQYPAAPAYQPIGGGGVSGSGTIGKIPRWVGATALGDSVLQQAAGGEISGATALTIMGGIAASNNLTLNSTTHATKGYVFTGTDGSFLRAGNKASLGPNVAPASNGPGNPQSVFRQERTDTAGGGGAGFIATWDFETDCTPSANSTALFMNTYTSMVKTTTFNVGGLYSNYNFMWIKAATSLGFEITGVVADIVIHAALSGADPSLLGFYSFMEANASASGIKDIWHFYAQDSIGGSSRTTGTQYGLYVTDLTSGNLGNYSIFTGAGLAHFGDTVEVVSGKHILLGGATAETGSTNTFAVKNGTAPDNGVADEVIFYSSDQSAGNTIPSFYCEGTAVLATGQADSASSTRVKMRINGTSVTLLGI